MISEFLYKQVNYKQIYTLANEILATSHVIAGFPFSVAAFLREQSDIRLCTFKKANEKYQVDVRQFGSESAVITEFNGAYIIFYNQDEQPYRIRFSIMHEFSHYILDHKMNLSADDPQYGIQELAANCCSAQLLMPEQILRECQHNRHRRLTQDFIKQSFDVSDEAAYKRIATLARTNAEWRSREERFYDDVILQKYAAKIDAIAPPVFNRYNFDDEYERQRERDAWAVSR